MYVVRNACSLLLLDADASRLSNDFYKRKAFDSHGKRLEDETPASADESPLEADWDPPKEPSSETR